MMVSNTNLDKEFELATKIAKKQGIENVEEILIANAQDAVKKCEKIKIRGMINRINRRGSNQLSNPDRENN